MMKKLLGLLTFLALLFGAAVALVIAIRTYDIQRAPALSIWHTHVPHDLRADEIAKLDWDGYLLAEQRVFDEVRTEIVDRIEPDERVASNRFFEGSPLYPGRFATDWNRVGSASVAVPSAPTVRHAIIKRCSVFPAMS